MRLRVKPGRASAPPSDAPKQFPPETSTNPVLDPPHHSTTIHGMKVGKVSWIPLVGSGAILVVVGFVAGRLTSPADSDSTTATGLSAQAEGSRAMLRPGSPDRPGSASDRRVVRSPSSDPLERMRNALGSGDLLDRTRAWLNFIDRLDADEFESVVAAYQSEGVGRDETGLYAMLLAGWAKMDPFAALDFAKENTSSQFARQTILTTWARSNPDAAIFWAESNHDGDGPNPWMVGVIRGLADDDPMRAGALMASLPYSGERGEALDAVMSGILKQSPDAVREWIAGIDDDRFREIAMARAAGSLAEADPGATADWLLANPGDAANRNIANVMSKWINQDEAAALAYFDQLPQGSPRSNAISGLVNSMATSDPREAAAFLESHAADANDGVYRQFAWNASRNDPEIAADMIGRIGDERTRTSTYSVVLAKWVRQDPQAAVEWINRTPSVPDSVIEQVNRQLGQTENHPQ